MARSASDRSDLKRFGILVAFFAMAFLLLGLIDGENIALSLQNSPTTTTGFLFIGWLVGGPPYALSVLVWLERRRLTKQSRLIWSVVLAAWIGMSLFILPARIIGVDEQFGTGALVGNPLSAGWIWGIVSTAIVAVIAGFAVFILSLSVKPEKARELIRRPVTRILLERLWLLALLVALGLALYGGNGTGIFNNGN
jgi:hypothetical protein